MKRFLFLLMLLLICNFSFAEQCSTQITLTESILRAKAHSRAIDMAEFDTLNAIADKNLVRSGFLPHIDAEGVVDNSNRALSDDLTQFQDFKPNRAVGIKAVVSLWDFGVTWKRFKASKIRIDASEMERESICLAIEEEVRLVYFKVLETEKLIKVLEASLETLQKQFCQTNDRFEQGIVKQTEILAIQVQLNDLEKTLIQMRNSLTVQKMALNRLIGLPLLEPISLVDIETNPPHVSFEQAVKYAMCYRPDFLAFQKQLEALTLERKALYWSLAPKIYAFANGNYSFPKSSGSAGVGLSMPIYHGGQKSAEILKIDAEIGKLETLIEESNDEILLEIKTLFLEFDEINSSFCLSEKAIALAEKQFFDTKELYEQGLVPVQDVLYAQDQTNEAKLSFFSNFYRWHRSFARLYTITGGYPQKTI